MKTGCWVEPHDCDMAILPSIFGDGRADITNCMSCLSAVITNNLIQVRQVEFVINPSMIDDAPAGLRRCLRQAGCSECCERLIRSTISLPHCFYLNNTVEQGHGAIKRRQLSQRTPLLNLIHVFETALAVLVEFTLDEVIAITPLSFRSAGFAVSLG